MMEEKVYECQGPWEEHAGDKAYEPGSLAGTT